MNAKERFYSHKWGVFNHFLYILQNDARTENSQGKHTDWNTLVEEFNVEKLAENLHKMGAKYYVITVMQGTKFMIAPNQTFDKIAGTKAGEACAKRDLIADMVAAFSKYGIDLFLYFTGDGPHASAPENEKFGFVGGGQKVSKAFVEKWASVLEEYALRYGDKIKGWWIDGCYRDYFGYTNELLEIYYKACKKGNPDALVACNNGVAENDLQNGCPFEDFLCGERQDFDMIPKQRFYGNAQAHLLAPLGVTPKREGLEDLIEEMIGPGWGCFGVKRDKEYLANYVRKVHEAGGVVTFDIGVYRDGSFDAEQVEVLKYVSKHV